MKIYAILNDDYGSYVIKKLFTSEKKQLEEFEKIIALEKENYIKMGYSGTFEDRGYTTTSLETFETED